MVKRKLGRADVLNIRAAKPGVCHHCGREKPFVKNLARYYKVNVTTISRIRRGRVYKDVK